jgi:hypothetical protein
MLTIFQFFATKTDASKLRMLNGSPAERLLKPITDYVEAKGGRLHIRWGCRCSCSRLHGVPARWHDWWCFSATRRLQQLSAVDVVAHWGTH